MGPDPTRAYFWPAVNKRPDHLWSGYFLTQPKEIFLNRREKIEKLGFRGNFPNINSNYRWLTWTDPSHKKLTWTHPYHCGQSLTVRWCKFWKIYPQNHKQVNLILSLRGIRPITIRQFAICQFAIVVLSYANLLYELFRHTGKARLVIVVWQNSVWQTGSYGKVTMANW